jgi:hypothetical protein
MVRRFTSFVGIDLGGARGKTTAVTHLTAEGGRARVQAVSTRYGGEPWVDASIARLRRIPGRRPGGRDQCAPDRAGLRPLHGAGLSRRRGRASIRRWCGCAPRAGRWPRTPGWPRPRAGPAEVSVPEPPAGRRAGHALRPPRDRAGPVPRARPPAGQPRRARSGWSPRAPPTCGGGWCGPGSRCIRTCSRSRRQATIAALFDRRRARGYKRDADPWQTRAALVERSPTWTSRRQPDGARGRAVQRPLLRRADRRVHGVPVGPRRLDDAEAGAPFVDDGWIWAPPPRD